MPNLAESLMLKDGGVVSFVGAGGKTSLVFRVADELSSEGETVLSTTTTKIFPPEKKQSPHVIMDNSSDEVLKKSETLLRQYKHITAVSGELPTENKLIGFSPEVIDKFYNSGMFQWILVEADGAAGRPVKVPAHHEPVIPLCSKWVVAVVGLDCIDKPLDEKYIFRSELYSEVTGIKAGEPVTPLSVATSITHERGIMKGCPSDAMRLVFLNKADQFTDLEKGRRVAMHLQKDSDSTLKRIIIGKVLDQPPVIEYYDKGNF